MNPNILFIGNKKPLNNIIGQLLESELNASLQFFTHEQIAAESGVNIRESLSLAIIDLNNIPGNVLKHLNKLKYLLPDIPLIVLQSYQNERLNEVLLEAGVAGILSTTPEEDVLLETIQKVLN